MNTPARLAIYSAGIVLVFGIMFLAGKALVPEETVATWTREAGEAEADHAGMETSGQDGHAKGGDGAHVRGLSIEQDGYRLGPIAAPGRSGEEGRLSFRVTGPDGEPFTDFAVNHERELHLIVVRSDGAGFQHLHPRMATSGQWSVPLTWPQGGTYRVFADFLPDGEAAPDVTLGRNVEVAGEVVPSDKPLSRTDSVDGFDLSIAGNLEAGRASELTVTVSRDGMPETHLEPYLGAFGHLVALREGDLAYLHVHAEDRHEEGGTGDESHDHGVPTAGPEVAFQAEAPTPGHYLLYLDFKVHGRVHTAEFVLEAK